MKKFTMTGTQWFSLSGRELLVLAMAAGVVVAGVGLSQIIGLIWGRGDITVEERTDVPPLPARIDVNVAEEYKLIMLPGLGPKTAQAIIEYREKHGPFSSFEELTEVKGIGARTLERIRPHAMCVPPGRQPKGSGS